MGVIFENLKNINLSRNNSKNREETRIFSAEIPLSTLKSGNYGIVKRLDGGEEFRSKMLALGIIPGKKITVTRGEKNNPYLLQVDESKVMMDWRTLEQIYIQSGTVRMKGGVI